MIGIDVQGLDRIVNRIDGMREKIQHFEHVDIPHEFADWETQDMHRHAPGVRHTRGGAKSLWRAHSRYEVRRHKLAQRRYLKRGVHPTYSSRPVVRLQMIDRLHERMVRMLNEKLRW
jgi:hypothetical protein